MHLALVDVFQAHWTDEIHAEWTRNVLSNRPDLRQTQLERTRQLMDVHVPNSLVAGYESLIPTLTLPDPDDRHVLAAAIHCRANVIVTFNLRDFPSDALKPYGIETQHPDDFVTRLLDLDATAVCLAVRRQRRSLRKPPKSVAEYFATLEAQGLTQTVARLRHFADVL